MAGLHLLPMDSNIQNGKYISHIYYLTNQRSVDHKHGSFSAGLIVIRSRVQISHILLSSIALGKPLSNVSLDQAAMSRFGTIKGALMQQS